MLVISPSKSLQKLELINTIQLLGYEEWIGECSNLHAVALSFQLLRQQGFYVSSGTKLAVYMPYLATASLLGLGDEATDEAFDWI
uniref:Sesquiterpene synthase n=1 Tax=Solanum tuberosum TaxID=4113 RepID=M1APQ5_SOLTU